MEEEDVLEEREDNICSKTREVGEGQEAQGNSPGEAGRRPSTLGGQGRKAYDLPKAFDTDLQVAINLNSEAGRAKRSLYMGGRSSGCLR